MTDKMYDAEMYRLAQAQELMLRFERANGHPAESEADLEAWVAGADLEKPIVPSDEAYRLIRNPA